MTEQFVVCGRCSCKYHNNEESIKEHFGIKRLGERYKTCVKCRPKVSDENHKWRYSEKGQAYYHTEFACPNCGETVKKNNYWQHRHRYKCLTHTMCPRPAFHEWLSTQDYESLTTEYKKRYDELDTYIDRLLSRDYETLTPFEKEDYDYFQKKRST